MEPVFKRGTQMTKEAVGPLSPMFILGICNMAFEKWVKGGHRS